MRNITSAFRRALADGRRDYAVRVVITLADSTVLNGTQTTYDDETGEATVTTVPYLTNENIWENGLTIEDAVSADNVFQVGAAIINQCKIVINNIYDTYSAYDFTNAKVIVYIGMNGLDDGSDDEVRVGTYTVDLAEYDDGIITLTCLDNMAKLDKPYDTTLAYPATIHTILVDAYAKCGVNHVSVVPPHSTFVIQNRPTGDATTYRQVVSWIAQITGRHLRCNGFGSIRLGFYDFDGLEDVQDNLDGGSFDADSPYSTGDIADGGNFSDYTSGYEYDAGGFLDGKNVHIISSDFSAKVATDDVVITGVQVAEKVDTSSLSSYANEYSPSSTYVVGDFAYYDSDLYKCIKAITVAEEFDRSHWVQISVMTYFSGQTGYVVRVENNDLIQSGNGQQIADWLAADLVGRRFRPAEITHPNDISIEAGDVGLFFDRRRNRYPIIISSTTFTLGSSQSTSSSAESPARNSAQRFSDATISYVEMRKQVEKETKYLSRAIAESSGLYSTTERDTSVTPPREITYYHDKPLKSDSNIVMMFTTAGFSMTADYQTPASQGGPTWYGMTVDGRFIADILETNGVNANWINTGELNGITVRLGDTGNVDGQLIVSTPNTNSSIVIDGQGITTRDETAAADTTDLYIGYHEIGFQDGIAEITTAGETENIPPGDTTASPITLPRVQFIAYSDGVALLYQHSGTFRNGLAVTNYNTYIWGDLLVGSGIKARIADTELDGQNVLYCYETPTPYFGDIGTGRTDENGEAVISIDALFADTIEDSIEYSVFLQQEGRGELWVSQKENDYFVVSGTPNLGFSWEVKAPQKGYGMLRLENLAIRESAVLDDGLERELDNELKESDLEYDELFA